MLDYLSLEKSRGPFAVVAVEQKCEVSISDVAFSLRVDRIDTNEEGEHIIIDYKTGQYSLTGLWQERLEAPQFPLYYVANYSLAPKILMSIKLNAKGCEYEGLSESPCDQEGIRHLDSLKDENKPKDWQSLHQYWLKRLTFLVEEFTQGVAKVKPLYSDTCQYCHLSTVCRVNEVSQ